MGERLKHKDKDQLERWIGTGPKTFTLLYAITGDGCNSKIFHEKCDGQGPTVTVLYNAKGSVYGGYSPMSWNSLSTSYSSCTEAFLFQLYHDGNQKATKFELKPGQYHYAVYNNPNYGPVFGYEYDLFTFNNNVTRTGATFPLNGGASFGKSYEMLGIGANDIHNGNFNVTELEVYRVTYNENKQGRPWREFDNWKTKDLARLKEDILSFKLLPGLNIDEARIVMIGPVGAGKSSFFNTIDSIFRGRITQRACSGCLAQSVTTRYIQYSVRTESGSSPKFILCDTPGLEESAGLDVDECCYLLDGNIPDYYLFNQKSTISPKAEEFGVYPTTQGKIHCVVFVLDATALDAVSDKVVEKVKNFQRVMNDREIPQLIVLTKIDKLCEDVQKDTSYTYKSWKVEEHVDKASELFGLRRSNVLPVKNYEKEELLDVNINTLTLLALRKILDLVDDYMQNLIDRQKFGQMKICEKK
ncbi:interferon-induced protein 44-like [Mercenaria mercenaria]|uniref:interferon-induced protein 44-like n=1 Tax=Mercenaria mercenaria TaxID=6596 RepID=UPI00234E41EC|nr:interferon-induced protein 44-like [Mercenaria mercenaria]XP_053373680.1 interferon-induced protein 44-like [Mercenaria mercenaria]